MLGNELRDRIKKGTVAGVYLFCGEEDYLKRHYLAELRKGIVCDEALAPFIHFVFEGATIDFGKLSDAVRAPAMMSDKKLIEWHLPHFEGMKEKELAAFEEFVKDALAFEENTVVFVATAEGLDPGTDRRPTKLAKRLGECCSLINFSRSTDAQLVGWIARHFSAEQIKIAAGLPQAMIARVGHSMDILANEIEKLVFYAKANGMTEVGEKEMEFVCIKTVESDAFSLSNALLDGKTEDAFRFLGDMKRRKLDPILVLSQLSRLYGDMLTVAILTEEGLSPAQIASELKMHEYKTGLYVKAAKKSGVAALERKLALCAAIDSDMKNGTASYIGLERLIAESAAQRRG